MLFVIVAQDITLGQFTPITDQMLWINKLSLVSKFFVVGAIVQSIVVIYIFLFDDADETEIQAFHRRESMRLLTMPASHNLESSGSQEDAMELSEDCKKDLASKKGKKGKKGSARTISPRSIYLQSSNSKESKKKEKWRGKKRPFHKKVKHFFMGSNIPSRMDSEKERKRKRLLVVDKITATVFFAAYMIYIIVAFTEESA